MKRKLPRYIKRETRFSGERFYISILPEAQIKPFDNVQLKPKYEPISKVEYIPSIRCINVFRLKDFASDKVNAEVIENRIYDLMVKN